MQGIFGVYYKKDVLIPSDHTEGTGQSVTEKKNASKITFGCHFLSYKEIESCYKLKFSNLYIFTNWWCKPLIFQTEILSNRILSLKYLNSIQHWVAKI